MSNWAAVALLIMTAIPAALGQGFERGPARSPHGTLKIACANCHTSTSWVPTRPVPEFDHNSQTRFPLRYQHAVANCRQCHVSLAFAEAGTSCADCHADIHRGQFGRQCAQCHTVRGWNVAVQAIRAHQNRFPLMGAHATVECEACHKGAATAKFTGLSTDCASCHLNDYRAASRVNHQTAGFPLQCAQCHGFDSWQTLRFDHSRFARFPLEGAHASVDCAACHSGGRFAGTSSNCVSCHAQDYASARSVDHVKAGFPTTCSNCHGTAGWAGAQFNHNTATTFALAGAHTQVSCASCHVGGVFAGTRRDCYSCHVANYEAAKNPNHVSSHFPTDCASCHGSDNWQNARFDHALTRFPLSGAHVQASCMQCHAGGFSGTSTQCASCHLSDYQKTTNPNHAAAGFPQDCSACHTTASFSGASFDHSVKTRFPLTGRHVHASCTQCHGSGQYAGLATACASCHLPHYQQTTNPNHAAAGFPQDCALCHTTSQWAGASFNHNAATRFPLTGAHVTAACSQCHSSGVYAGLNNTCASCHLANYQKTTNPNHAAAGFPQDCSLCHSTAQWSGASFDHSKTQFPLTGRHVGPACAQCHSSGVYAGLSTACASCHLSDYQKTTNPNHAAAGFPQQCEVCHTSAGFTPASFNHSATNFPLTGAHATVACANCHLGGKYAGTPTGCYSCHKAQFDSTSDPNHMGAGFPTTCQTCHSTASWSGATFNHTWFPRNHGRAAGCATCHTNPLDYKVFQCTVCHTKAATDSEHRGRPGYVYNSANCYQCHPRGNN